MTNQGALSTNKYSNSNALLSKERQFSTPLYNWCVKYTMGKGAEGTGKDVFLWLARFELYLQAGYLWMINKVLGGGIYRGEKKGRKGNMLSISQITKNKSSACCPEQCYLKISWPSKLKGWCLFIHNISIFIWITFSSLLNFREMTFRLMKNIFSVWLKF